MIDWVMSFWGNTYIAILCYWMPMAVCFVGYTIRTNENLRNDLKNRHLYEYWLESKTQVIKGALSQEAFDNRFPGVYYHYSPTDKYGSLIGRGLLTFIPVVNIFASIFDVSPKLFRSLINWIAEIFDTPLVPHPANQNLKLKKESSSP